MGETDESVKSVENLKFKKRKSIIQRGKKFLKYGLRSAKLPDVNGAFLCGMFGGEI